MRPKRKTNVRLKGSPVKFSNMLVKKKIIGAQFSVQ